MAKQANILSFDEAKRAASANRPSFAVPRSARPIPRASSQRTVEVRVGEGARRAVFDECSLEEEEGEGASRKKTLRGKVSDARRARSKAKAERAFTRQFGSECSAGSSEGSAQTGSRAAVYKGEMGQSHRRAARMQNETAAAKTSGKRPGNVNGFDAAQKRSSRLIAAGVTLVCVLFACLFLYQPAQQYYQALREHDRLQAEYDAVAARNQALQSEVDALNSDVGVESRAREYFGWVKEGENAVVVYGVENAEDDEDGVIANIVPGSVEAPETWYSPVLDAVFGVE